MLSILVGVVLGACAGNPPATAPSSTAAPSASVTATATPVPSPTMINGRIVVSNLDENGAAVVAGILFPPTGGGCASNGKYDACPVTDALAARLDANPLQRAEPLCRCQNTYQSRTITTEPLQQGNPGATAHVVLNFGGSTVRLDVTVLRTPGGWFANDTSCTGQDATTTSLYVSAPPPCA